MTLNFPELWSPVQRGRLGWLKLLTQTHEELKDVQASQDTFRTGRRRGVRRTKREWERINRIDLKKLRLEF